MRYFPVGYKFVSFVVQCYFAFNTKIVLVYTAFSEIDNESGCREAFRAVEVHAVAAHS